MTDGACCSTGAWSFSEAVTVAVFVKNPAWVWWTVIVIVTVAFLATLPIVQVTGCVAGALAWTTAESKTVPAGSGSLTTTFVAVLGPTFLIVTV